MNAIEHTALEHMLELRDQLHLRRTTQKRLVAFERELCGNNRFFPRTDILDWVDAIAPMVARTLAPGTTLYRGRIIPKAQEHEFMAPVYNALGIYVHEEEGDLGSTRFAEAFVEREIERLESGQRRLSFAEFRHQLDPFRKRGWWGYGKKESDAAPSDVTGSGRINPAGISYLYASSRKETAALEARPVISQMVSIAEVVTTEEIRLFDLTRNVFDDGSFDVAPDDETRMFRKILAHYFSKPNYSGERAYLVTQYLSEYVKSRIEARCGLRFDGIGFSSSRDRKGTNYVIFDTAVSPKYRIVASSLERVTDMRGQLETLLPMGDTIIRALMDGSMS